MKRFSARLIASLGLFLAMTSAVLAQSPADVVKTFQDGLMSVWQQARGLTFDERFRRLQPLVAAAFDLEQMIATASGGAWRSASPDEQARLVAAFKRFSVSTYAARFDNHTGQRMEIVSERRDRPDLALVDTRIVANGDKPVELTYVLNTASGPWRIVDVLLDGSVSDVAVRRAEYRRVLRQGGPAALAAELDRLSTSLAAEAAAKRPR